MKKVTVPLLSLSAAILVFSGCSTEQSQDISGTVKQDLETKRIERMQPKGSDLSAGVTPPKQNNPNNSQKPMNQTPPADVALAEKYQAAILKTNFGDIKVEFFAEESPITVSNFLKLAQEDFYNQTRFHRVIPNFMIQGGDPNSKDDNWSNDGQGGPGYKFADEFNSHKIVRGSLAMANSGPGTNGSQFFIVTADATPHLDGRHTNFGKVTEGMSVVDQIEKVNTNAQDHPTDDVTIENIELIEK